MQSRRLKYLLLTCLTGLLLMGLPFTALGRSNTDPNSQSSQNHLQQREVQALRSKVQESGRIRVIVELDLAFEPEGEIHSSTAVLRQRLGIQQAQRGLSNRLGLGTENRIRSFKYVPQLVLTVDEAQLDTLFNDPYVLHVQEDGLSAPTLASSVPHIGGDNAWAAGFTGEGQVVAILDTGVDNDHEFLTGRVVSEACYSNAAGFGVGTEICPNGSYEQIGTGAAAPCAVYGCDHGTHVAGIAAGKGATFSGVAPDAEIIAIQVFTQFTDPICSDYGQPASPCILTYDSDTIFGLERVYELRNTFKIAAVNLSLGGGAYSSPCPGDSRAITIQNLRSVGIATIVASGNNAYTSAITSPACIPNAISVGSTTLSDNVSSFSNVAYFLEFFAPGSSIYSSLPNDNYGLMNGTSMATPHVTGAWAVIKSKIPDGSVDFISNLLSSTGIPVDDNRGGGSVTDIPRIQLDLAIEKITLKLFPSIRHKAAP